MKKIAMITLISMLIVFVSNSFAVEVTLLGPKQYSRTKGQPDLYTDTFPGIAGQGKLIVKNGDANGKNRVSSALISVNGTQILGPSDFNRQIYDMEIPVNLNKNNKISVELRSKPGSYLIARVIQDAITETTVLTYPTLYPSAINAGFPTSVYISTEIGDPSLVVRSVCLQRLDGSGNLIANLGFLNDDGLDGDMMAGDKRFSSKRTFLEAHVGNVRILIAAFIEGIPKVFLSKIIELEVSPPDIPNDISPSDPSKIISDPETGIEMISDEIIVFFVEGIAYESIQAIIKSVNGEIIGRIPELGAWQTRIRDVTDVSILRRTINMLNTFPEVKMAHPNFIGEPTTDDPIYQWQWGLTKIAAPQAWFETAGWDYSSRLVIGIIDSGVNYNHEDLKETLQSGQDDYRVINKKGFPLSDVVNQDDDPMDDHGHGTFMAGIAAAVSNNKKGIAGVSGKTRVIAVKVIDNNDRITSSDLAKGITRAADMGARILNLSLTVPDYPYIVEAAIQKAIDAYGCLVIASAGNRNSSNIQYPAGINHRYLIAVGATDENDNRAIWDSSLGGQCNSPKHLASNFGSRVDLSAPGTDIWSLIFNNNSGYGSWCTGGTSAAAAFVSGAAALVWSHTWLLHPGWDARAVREAVRGAIVETADLTSNCDDDGYQIKRLNLYNAIRRVKGLSSPPQFPGGGPDTISPTIDILNPTNGTNYLTNQPTINISGEASDNLWLAEITWSNSATGSQGKASGKYSWFINGITLLLGENIITVTARDEAGNTGNDIITVTYTPPDTQPPNTTITSGPIITDNNVTFTYTGSDDVTLPSNLVYTTYLQGYDSGWSNFTIQPTKTYPNLPNGPYTFYVKAKDQAEKIDPNGDSRSFTINYTPPDRESPSIPQNLVATAVSASQINLSWSASTDNVGVVGYRIYRNDRYLKSVGGISASDTGLSPGATYCYSVSAYDAAGNDSGVGEGEWVCATTFEMDVVQLPKTGQTISYYSGDDGDIQAGLAWPSTRFTNPDGTTPITGNVVVDKLTGLMWARDAGVPTVGVCPGGTKTWQQALDYVACLNSTNHLGYNDWRLSNIIELESLANVGEPYNASWLISQGFLNILQIGNTYWSSTTTASDTNYAYVVYVDYPSIAGYYKITEHCVWPVRGTTSGQTQLWRTGQTANYSSGDDGQLKNGVDWPSPRFTINLDTTIKDNLTGLIWVSDAGTPTTGICAGGKRTWEQALNYITCLNNNSYIGYTDWRLPNRKELLSLIDYSQFDPSLPLDHPFINIQAIDVGEAWYWSSTTPVIAIPEAAWVVNMYYSVILYHNKTNTYYVWPVRSGVK